MSTSRMKMRVALRDGTPLGKLCGVEVRYVDLLPAAWPRSSALRDNEAREAPESGCTRIRGWWPDRHEG